MFIVIDLFLGVIWSKNGSLLEEKVQIKKHQLHYWCKNSSQEERIPAPHAIFLHLRLKYYIYINNLKSFKTKQTHRKSFSSLINRKIKHNLEHDVFIFNLHGKLTWQTATKIQSDRVCMCFSKIFHLFLCIFLF